MIDSHCHLADRAFEKDLEAILKRAREQGIEKMICIGDSIEESEQCIAIAEKFENVFATVGVHPHVSKDWKEGTLEQLKGLVDSSEKVVAIGEIGLDYHYNFSEKSVQLSAFSSQLSLAKELNLPAVVHCRSAPHQSKLGAGRAVEDVWKIVDEIKPSKLVLHCCTEKYDDVKRFLDRGYFLSFTGIATYPNAGVIRETIQKTPLEQMMIETDAPYLAPIPHRGKRNEPTFVTEVAKCIAQVRGIDLEEVDRVTTRNAETFFSLHNS